jgi:hypothetical protein
MQLICTSCFARPAPTRADAGDSVRIMVCPEGPAVAGRPAAEELHCDCCGHLVHFDALTRIWYEH